MSLTFVTGALSRVGSHLALAARRAGLPDAQGPWDTHLARALLLARIWAGFLAGALLSGATTPRFGAWVLSAPALILAALAVRPARPGAGLTGRAAGIATPAPAPPRASRSGRVSKDAPMSRKRRSAGSSFESPASHGP